MHSLHFPTAYGGIGVIILMDGAAILIMVGVGQLVWIELGLWLECSWGGWYGGWWGHHHHYHPGYYPGGGHWGGGYWPRNTYTYRRSSGTSSYRSPSSSVRRSGSSVTRGGSTSSVRSSGTSSYRRSGQNGTTTRRVVGTRSSGTRSGVTTRTDASSTKTQHVYPSKQYACRFVYLNKRIAQKQ